MTYTRRPLAEVATRVSRAPMKLARALDCTITAHREPKDI